MLSGVSPVLEVPFTDAGEVDAASVDRLLGHVLTTGVRSVMFPGFASEVHKLHPVERRALVRQVLDAVAGTPHVGAIVSVPDHATVLAVREAVWAVENGADAVNLLPPSQLSPPADQVLAHLSTVLSAVAPTPVVLQYAPAQTGAIFRVDDLTALAAAHPNLRAVKVETPLPGRVVAALRAGRPPLASLVGYAGLQLPDALRRGVAGVQPGCSFAEIYVAIWRSWHGGEQDAALALHARLLPYLAYWMQEVELIISVEKLVSRRRGLIVGEHCRRPARLLDDHEVAMVDRFLDELGDLLPEVAP